MDKKGIILSGLIYILLTFFLLLIGSILMVLWHRQATIEELKREAKKIFDDVDEVQVSLPSMQVLVVAGGGTGDGGSGIIIVRYPGSPMATVGTIV